MRLMLLCTAILFIADACLRATAFGDEPALSYTIDLKKAHQGFDGETCWVHARAGSIPPGKPGNDGDNPLVVMTMQKLELAGSDIFHPLNELHTQDLGRTWSQPVEQSAMHRTSYQPDQKLLSPGAVGFSDLLKPGDVEVLCDFTPQWHQASSTLLGIGHTAWYRNNRVFPTRPRVTGYSTFDPSTKQWRAWKALDLSAFPELRVSGAGCVQWQDQKNGEILLPVYGRTEKETATKVAVLRCKFDGSDLTCIERGNLLTVPVKRGVGEPSLTSFQNRYYLTIRHDDRSYVAKSEDGLNYTDPWPWTFDDGTELGSYNTQTHWVTHSDGLFLVYTRRGANNDHVFRHRAPLFMAQVDPERLHVIRSTERILVPERGARLGNFGVVDVSPQETWVTAAEWMQPKGVEKHGSDNSVFVARLIWNRPNLRMVKQGE